MVFQPFLNDSSSKCWWSFATAVTPQQPQKSSSSIYEADEPVIQSLALTHRAGEFPQPKSNLLLYTPWTDAWWRGERVRDVRMVVRQRTDLRIRKRTTLRGTTIYLIYILVRCVYGEVGIVLVSENVYSIRCFKGGECSSINHQLDICLKIYKYTLKMVFHAISPEESV